MEALTKQDGIRLLGKFKKKFKKKEVKTDLPYLSFYQAQIFWGGGGGVRPPRNDLHPPPKGIWHPRKLHIF
jgi:hypothetical protein